MHIHQVGFYILGFSRLAQIGPDWEMIPNEAEHGPTATGEAFMVISRTFYRWQRTFTQASGDPQELAACSSAPHRRRQATWPPQALGVPRQRPICIRL